MTGKLFFSGATALLVAWAGPFTASVAFGASLIVEGGQARAEIVVAENPARMTRLAAHDLQAYLERISGAKLPVVTAPGTAPVKIYVGLSAHTERLGITTEGLAHGAFRMVSGPDWLALVGPDRDDEPLGPRPRSRADIPRARAEWDALNPGEYYGFPYGANAGAERPFSVSLRDDGGTYNAVCEFLAGLGVRWYFPGELGEVVPVLADITLPAVDRTAVPDFAYRVPSYWRNDPDTILWTLRLGGFAGQEIHGTTQNCHGLKWLVMRDEAKQAHPEWYALINGRRLTDHTYAGAPCLSSPELFERNLKFARFMYDALGEALVNVDPPDGYGNALCQCELCAGKFTPERGLGGTMSDYVFDYANRVAAELYKTHPDRKVSVLSYSAYKLPPEKLGQLSPNLVLWMCRWRSNFHDPTVRARELELRRDWLKVLSSGEIYIYDYYLHPVPSYGFEGLPVYYPRLIAEDLRSLKGISGGELFEVYLHANPADFAWHPLAVTHLNIYTTLRLLWDADQDLDALLEEFYEKFYGPAAGPMKAFIEYSEANWPLMRTKVEAVDGALARLAAARDAVETDSVYGRRIGLVTAYTAKLTQLREQLARGRENTPGAGARVLPAPALAGRKLDGRLDDANYWPKVRELPLREVETGNSPGRGLWSIVRVFRAGDALYFGIHCGEPDVANLDSGPGKNGGTDIRQGDFVEILLETQTHSYYRITVSPAGVLEDADCREGTETRWKSGAQAAVHVGENYWSVEVRVPIAGEGARAVDPLLGIDGRMPSDLFPWYFNVGRQRVRDGQVERFAFSPTGTREFNEISRFTKMWSK